MAASDPVDEKVWCDPWEAQMNGGINSNSVLHYFARSPFFDPTSNNNAVFTQSAHNPDLLPNIATREAFESTLARMNGIQYVVWHDPEKLKAPPETAAEKKLREEREDKRRNRKLTPKEAELMKADAIRRANEAKERSTNDFQDRNSMMNGVWIIRKQHRVVNPAGVTLKITPLAIYYVVGINVFQAPSIGSAVNSRLLNTYKALADSFQVAAPLPQFSASRGTFYEAEQQQTRQAMASRTAQASVAGTPLPDNASVLTGPTSKRSTNAFGDGGLLAKSLSLALQWKDEFMDENPLQGEPGSFVMKKSTTDNTLVKPSQTVKPATPLPPPIETSVENPLNKGAKSADGAKKRKRSKIAGTTTTPK